MDLERIQQGRLLNTIATEKMTYDQREKCNRQEQSMMLKRFTETDQGRSREYLATFQSPEECKAFVDNYNELLGTINMLKYENNELRDAINMLQYELKEAIDEIGDHC